jgi:hypothetical protein
MSGLLGLINPAPNPSDLPGSDQILSVLAGLRWGCLVACLVALSVGAAVWAFSSPQGNPYYVSRGRTAVLGAIAGVLLVGAAPALIQWFFDLGSQVSP